MALEPLLRTRLNVLLRKAPGFFNERLPRFPSPDEKSKYLKMHQVAAGGDGSCQL